MCLTILTAYYFSFGLLIASSALFRETAYAPLFGTVANSAFEQISNVHVVLIEYFRVSIDSLHAANRSRPYGKNMFRRINPWIANFWPPFFTASTLFYSDDTAMVMYLNFSSIVYGKYI